MDAVRGPPYTKLRTVHHQVLLRIIGAQRKRPDHWMTSYNRALEITRCESIETTLRTRRLLWAGTLIRMSGGWLPKRIMFGNLEGAVRRGRGGKEKEWTDCIQSDIRAFGITGDWKTMTLKTEGGEKRGRRGQTSPGEERGNETGKVVIAHGSVEFCEATPIGLANESKKSLHGREADRDLRNADLRSA